MNELVANVIQWGLDRNIIQDSDLLAQIKKLREEFDELEEAILTKNSTEIADAIGDMTVVLTIMAEIYGRDYDAENYVPETDIDLPSYLEWCLEGAYDVIKDRKGKLIDGVFVKESDLVDN